jgi:hypothetical protein
VAWALYLPRTSRGRGALLLLALAPTDATRLAGVAEAPHGPWRVQADCRAPVSPVQAWVARNDLDRGTLLRGRPSTLVDERDDPSRWLRGNGDDPGKRPGDADPLQARSGSVLRRRGSVLRQGRTAGRAAGAAQGRIHVVAGYVLQSGDHAPYSAAGDADSPHLAAPTAAAVSDQSRVLPGLRVAGAHGAVGTRLVGTSLAAPLYARDLINRLAAAGTGPVLPPRPWRPTAAAPVADEDDLFGGAGRIPLGP